MKTIESNPEAFSEFELTGIRSAKKKPFLESMLLMDAGLSEAAGESGNKEFLKKLIYAQVRNVLRINLFMK
ncbi:MAG: hypothetical protein ACLSEY_14785 [Enterocloster sp.]